MPVIGHTFAGILIAQAFEPAGRRNPRPVGPVARALWIPALVGLSYLPDVVTQIVLWLGYRSAQAVGHSLPLGITAGAAIGFVWARMSGGSTRVLVALAVGSIVFHDLLDLLQDAQRMPFWPLSSRQMGVEWAAISSPDRLLGELLVFGIPFLLYEAWHLPRHRHRQPAPAAPAAHSRIVWIGRGLVVAVLLSAFAVLQLRRVREQELDHAEQLVRARQFAEALAAIDRADRWPSRSAMPDVVRGRAYRGLGDPARAEASFKRAYERDPDDFWTVASLAEYYASRGTAAEREQRSAPYVEELERRFSRDAALPRVLDAIRRSVEGSN